VAAYPVETEVMWFNASKGFGFVKLSDGREAYLHIRVLEAAGSRSVSDGTALKVTVEESPRGHQVVQVLEIGDQIAKTPTIRISAVARGAPGRLSPGCASAENCPARATACDTIISL
jgi:cold shock CspA family protein